MIRLVTLATALLALAATGCSQPGMVSVSAIDAPVNAVCDRHDAYVEADTSLSDLEKETYLRTTTLLRRVVEEARPH